MENNLKFRVWDKYSKIFINNLIPNILSSVVLDTNKYINFIGEMEDSKKIKLRNHYDADEFIIQQFMALKDSNNKDIYDGDIIEWSEKINWFSDIPEIISKPVKYRGEIHLSLIDGALVDIFGVGTDIAIRYKDLYPVDGIRVIGNVLENKDLIK